MQQHDVVISGGGLAGLIATLLFARAGFSTLCIDATPDDAPEDLRSTAFLGPGLDRLAEAGLEDVITKGTPLEHMRIIDAENGQIHRDVQFSASEIDRDLFGRNLANTPLRRALLTAIDATDGAERRAATTLADSLARDTHRLIRLSDGSRIEARLLIAADGRNSLLRREAGIKVRRTELPQSALVCHLDHPLPHGNCSIEVHDQGGPFTLVPLDTPTRSALVWMSDRRSCAALRALDPDAFAAAASLRSAGVLGPLTLASDRAVWPMIAQTAHRLTDRRLALIAEAAHVVPPIGAQGLNMSLADMACLRDLAIAQPDQLGSTGMLAAYERRRLPEILMRSTGIGALGRASMVGASPLRQLRRAGLDLIAKSPLKHPLMRLGLGR